MDNEKKKEKLPSKETAKEKLDRLYGHMLDRMKRLLEALKFRDKQTVLSEAHNLEQALKNELGEAPDALKDSLETAVISLEKAVKEAPEGPNDPTKVQKNFAALQKTITTSQEDGTIPQALGQSLAVVAGAIVNIVIDTVRFIASPVKTWNRTVAQLQEEEGPDIHII